MKAIDTTAIEEKALNYFKAFIEDSKVISRFLNEGDKEPCWDGHLYLYSDGNRDKEHLLGRVPVQIKGTEVETFITKNWKFKLEKVDLKAYLHEPTFFIVCQIKKDSKERKLFYREMMPDFVKKLLRDMNKQGSKKTLFYPLTEDLAEFEDQLKMFLSNSKKMVSFADSKPFSMADAMKRGIKDFTCIAPGMFTGMELMKYHSTHDTNFYAKVSKDLDVEMPLSDGPARLAFKKESDGDVRIGDRLFYKGYTKEIQDGRFIVSIANTITIDMPMDATDKVKPSIRMTTKEHYLKDAIKDAEFAIALNDTGAITIDTVELQLAKKEKDYVEDLRQKLVRWKELDDVLDKLHVTKAFDLTKITEEQGHQIDVLVDTVGKGNTIKLPGQQTSLLTMEISNVTLLLWCVAGTDGVCTLGDFFDKTIELSYKVNDEEIVKASPFSYLQTEKLWEKIDNIDYDNLVGSAETAAKGHDFCYIISNYDVLAMIAASDNVKETDPERSQRLLEEALKLDEWLIGNDPIQEMKPVHIINKLQIIKRQREYTDGEKRELEKMIDDESEDSMKVAVYLLLDRQTEAEAVFNMLPEEEEKGLKDYPIWRFYKKP